MIVDMCRSQLDRRALMRGSGLTAPGTLSLPGARRAETDPPWIVGAAVFFRNPFANRSVRRRDRVADHQ
jgi:hypothetical protein